MKIEEGKLYKTRAGDIVRITQDASDYAYEVHGAVYPVGGYITDRPDLQLCWTHEGKFDVHARSESRLDLVSEYPEQAKEAPIEDTSIAIRDLQKEVQNLQLKIANIERALIASGMGF